MRPDLVAPGQLVLALAHGPDSSVWVGTYGQGIFVLRPKAVSWEHIQSSSDTAKHAISWDFVHAFGFGTHLCVGANLARLVLTKVQGNV